KWRSSDHETTLQLSTHRTYHPMLNLLQRVGRYGCCNSESEPKMCISTILAVSSHKAHTGLYNSVMYFPELPVTARESGDLIDRDYIELTSIPGRQERCQTCTFRRLLGFSRNRRI